MWQHSLCLDEALRENVRCPNVECRRTDELLSHAYNSTASLGRVSNSLVHMLVALHSSQSEASFDPLVVSLTELALQAMGVITNHCGTALGTLVQAQRNVGIICDDCRWYLDEFLDQLHRKLWTFFACWSLKLVCVMWGQPQDPGPLQQPLVPIIIMLV